MSLRERAALDARRIIEDTSGFGWPITVTNPAGQSLAMTGLSTDIGFTINPDTGVAVSGRKASVALAIATLEAAGMGLPYGVGDTKKKPWVIEFADIGGAPHLFKVVETMPDRAIGCITCIVEDYKRS